MSRTQNWLDGYIRAWRSKDAEDIRAIFTDDAEYFFHPDEPDPAKGIDAIIAMWGDEPAEPQFDLRVLIEDDRLGIVTGWVDYPGLKSFSNLWEVWFAHDGRAERFVEWYVKRPEQQDMTP
jgi:hypothetical protein